MTVKAILSNKGGDIISIDPTANLETAVKKLAQHRTVALLVLDRSVSDREFIRTRRGHCRARRRRAHKPLAAVMTRVVTSSETETVGTIMERMTTGKFRHVPVIEQDQVVGVIWIGDVVSIACIRWSRSGSVARLHPDSVMSRQRKLPSPQVGAGRRSAAVALDHAPGAGAGTPPPEAVAGGVIRRRLASARDLRPSPWQTLCPPRNSRHIRSAQ